jgi:hypothetical protein
MSHNSREEDEDKSRRVNRALDDESDEPDSRDLDRDEYQTPSHSTSKFTPFPDLIAVQSFLSNDSEQPSSTQPNLTTSQAAGSANDASNRHAPDISIVPGRPSYKGSYINFDSLNAPSPSSSSGLMMSASSSSSTAAAAAATASSSGASASFEPSPLFPSSSTNHYATHHHHRPSSSTSASYASSSSSSGLGPSPSSSSFVSSSRSGPAASSSNGASNASISCPPASSSSSSSYSHKPSSSNHVSASGVGPDNGTARALQSALMSLQQSVDRVYRTIDQRMSQVESKLDHVTDEIRRAQNERDLAPHAQAADSIRGELQQFQRDQRQVSVCIRQRIEFYSIKLFGNFLICISFI